MTAAEFRAWREARRLSQREAATLLGAGLITIRRSEQQADDAPIAPALQMRVAFADMIESADRRLALMREGKITTGETVAGGGHIDTTARSIAELQQQRDELQALLARR